MTTSDLIAKFTTKAHDKLRAMDEFMQLHDITTRRKLMRQGIEYDPLEQAFCQLRKVNDILDETLKFLDGSMAAKETRPKDGG